MAKIKHNKEIMIYIDKTFHVGMWVSCRCDLAPAEEHIETHICKGDLLKIISFSAQIENCAIVRTKENNLIQIHFCWLDFISSNKNNNAKIKMYDFIEDYNG